MRLKSRELFILVAVVAVLTGLFRESAKTTAPRTPDAPRTTSAPQVADALLWVSFDGQARDEGPFNHKLEAHGVQWTGDRFGNPMGACNFGRGAYVRSEFGSELQRLDEFTLCAWVKPDHYVTHGNILSKVVPSRDFNLQLDQQGRVLTHIANGPYEFCYSKRSIPLNKWTFVAATYRAKTWTLYIDGELEVSKTVKRDPAWNCQNLTIGELYPGAGEVFPGALDDVGLFGRALTPAEIAELQAGGAAASLVWRGETSDR